MSDSIDNLIEYVLNTPQNTNPAILRQYADEVANSGGGGSLPFNVFNQILLDTTDSLEDINTFLSQNPENWVSLCEDGYDYDNDTWLIVPITLLFASHKISVQYNDTWFTSPVMFVEAIMPFIDIAPEVESGDLVGCSIRFVLNDTASLEATIAYVYDPESGDTTVELQSITFIDGEVTYTDNDIWQVVQRIIVSK